MLSAQDSINTDSIALGPLYEPETVQFSFQTPGWYFLAGMLFLLAVFVFYKWLKNYLKNAYRREALKNLAAIEEKYNQQNDSLCLNDVLILLKLVAIKAFGRQNVAQLYGNNWLLFLEEKGKDTPFSKYSSAILSAAYNPGETKNDEVVEIISLTQKWIKTHA